MRDNHSEPILPTVKCGRFLTGHEAHRIRGKLAFKEMPWPSVDDIWMDGETIAFVVNDILITGWNHDPDFVQRLIDSGRPPFWIKKYQLLAFESETESGLKAYNMVGVDDHPTPEGCTGTATDGFELHEGSKNFESELREALKKLKQRANEQEA